jgi:hypothetical protein
MRPELLEKYLILHGRLFGTPILRLQHENVCTD